jgi:hypothetical protein
VTAIRAVQPVSHRDDQVRQAGGDDLRAQLVQVGGGKPERSGEQGSVVRPSGEARTAGPWFISAW